MPKSEYVQLADIQIIEIRCGNIFYQYDKIIPGIGKW